MKNNNKLFYRKTNLIRSAVAAVLGSTVSALYVPPVLAAEEEDELEEVVVTGSRIVRRDLETNSPLLTIDAQQFQDNAFISVEEALNDLPQFMAGGVGMGSNAVTSLQGANGLEGGLGSGDAFNSSLLPNNAQALGVVIPGAANVNLRGLGANRSLTLIDGHRAMPLNASMIVDLNTIPSIAIGGMEIITGGASAVYGADALAGVTNIKFRDNYEGMQLRVRGGMNEVGDGEEYQLGTLIGANFADGRGNVLIGMEYSKRSETLWNERDFFLEAQNSPYSGSGNFIFGKDPYYSSGAGFGSENILQNDFRAGNAWNGNAPSLAAINSVFSDRSCTGLNCIPTSAAFNFNPDGSLYTRNSNIGTTYYGPQGFNQTTGPGSGREVTCAFTSVGTSQAPGYEGQPCNPTASHIDNGRWLSGPRDAYNMFARATFDLTENTQAYTNFHIASSSTVTRREPAPLLGGFGVVIPFDSTLNGNDTYLPSLNAQTGATRPEFLTGGVKGTTCGPIGGCTMSQAFPVPAELRTLLESRSGSAVNTAKTGALAPFRGLAACQNYTLATAAGPGVLTNPTTGAMYTIDIDPNTGKPVQRCGGDAGWQLNQTPSYLPPRGTENTANLFQIAMGLRGDLGISDWTWDLYASTGTSETQTNYIGFVSVQTYQNILSAPNYGKGFSEVGSASKYYTCTSGMSPFDPNLTVSQDCIDAITARSIDRNTMQQRIFEGSAQGRIMDLPAGEVRAAVGSTYRWNAYEFTPDALLDRHYTRDYSAGAFGSGDLNEEVSVKEVYGELLIPLLRDLPLIESLELELGARYSDYSTGQEVSTYKVLGSWTPVEWMRVRGGYNRAERAPNMSELYATPNGSAQFGSAPVDPCRNASTLAASFPGPTAGSTNNNSPTTDPAFRQKLQALCSAHINAWGGNNQSEFHADPDNWDVGGGSALVQGNPGLANEQGDTWTLGTAFTSPFEHELLSSISGTIDWYRATVTDPVELLQTSTIVNSCYNINGLNPQFSLDDPNGFCSLLERDPGTGAFSRVYIEYANQGKLQIEGIDIALRWTSDMASIGLGMLPGALAINTNANFLLEQTQRYGVANIDDYTGYGGAAEFRANTGFTYLLDDYRVSLMWIYRSATDTATTFATVANAQGSTGPTLSNNALFTGYKANHNFNLTASKNFGAMNASFSINNLFNQKPRAGGYDVRDPLSGFGTFSPFDDLVGRRYSFSLNMEF